MLIYFIYTLFNFSFPHLPLFISLIVTTVYNNNIFFVFLSNVICIRTCVLFNVTFIIIWWYLFNNFICNCLALYLPISFTFIFLLKYGNSFRNSSSHIVFADLFLSLLLNRPRRCCGTGFKYCTSGSRFILFLRFKCSGGCGWTLLIYSMHLLYFLFFCISFFWRNIWGKLFLSVWFLIK